MREGIRVFTRIPSRMSDVTGVCGRGGVSTLCEGTVNGQETSKRTMRAMLNLMLDGRRRLTKVYPGRAESSGAHSSGTAHKNG